MLRWLRLAFRSSQSIQAEKLFLGGGDRVEITDCDLKSGPRQPTLCAPRVHRASRRDALFLVGRVSGCREAPLAHRAIVVLERALLLRAQNQSRSADSVYFGTARVRAS